MLFNYLAAGVVFALLAVFFLPRRMVFLLGLICLCLGLAVPLGLWAYAGLFVNGDDSTQGMLGTLCVILFAPPGLVMTLLAYFK